MRHRQGSRFLLITASAVVLFFVVAVLELMPAFLRLLVRLVDADSFGWHQDPRYWALVAVFCLPVAVAAPLVLLIGGRRWPQAVLAFACAYALSAQWSLLFGPSRPVLGPAEDLPVVAADVLRVAAYPSLVLVVVTGAVLGVRWAWDLRGRPQAWALAYGAVALTAVVAAGWLNAARYV